MVSRVAALVLEANPDLGWRDVKAILAQSASRNDPNDSDWTTNGANLHINHKYGYGIVDATKAIGLALKWNNFGKKIIVEKSHKVDIKIPDNDSQGLEDTITIDKDIYIEFVDIFFDAHDHKSLGDLEIILTSPQGTKSILAEKHAELFDGYFRYKNWRFGTFRLLNEKSKGTWKLAVEDKREENEGTFSSWGIKIYGHYKKKSK